MLSLFESTAILEQNLSLMRMCSRDERAHTSRENVRTLMKLHLDVTDPVVVYNSRERSYTLTAFGTRCFNLYRQLFPAGTNVKKKELPKRVMKRKLSSTGMAAFLRVQEEQKANLVAQNLDSAEAESLKKMAEQSSRKRASPKQESLRECLRKKIEAKVAVLSPENFESDAKARLARLQAEEKERQNKLLAMEVRELSSAPAMDMSGSVVVCVIQKADMPSADKIIKETSQAVRSFASSAKIVHLTSSALVPRALEAKSLIWLATSSAAERNLLQPQQDEDDSSGLGLSAALARCFGGWVGGPTWLQTCRGRGMALEPVLKLSPACSVSRQIYFDESFRYRAALLKVLAIAESHPAGYRSWVIRTRREELLLGPF